MELISREQASREEATKRGRQWADYAKGLEEQIEALVTEVKLLKSHGHAIREQGLYAKETIKKLNDPTGILVPLSDKVHENGAVDCLFTRVYTREFRKHASELGLELPPDLKP